MVSCRQQKEKGGWGEEGEEQREVWAAAKAECRDRLQGFFK